MPIIAHTPCPARQAARLAAFLCAAIASACTAPYAPTALATPPAGTPAVRLASAPSELRFFHEPQAVCVGGSTMLKVFAMGVASDGNLRGVPDLPVAWHTSAGDFQAVGPMSARTDNGGLAAMVLNVPHGAAAIAIEAQVSIGGLTSAMPLVAVSPCAPGGPTPTPTPTPAPGPTGATGATGATGGTGARP